MDRPMSGLGFNLMAFFFRIRDLSRPRAALLKEAEIESGSRVLDYGCGPGGYIEPLSKIAGPSGEIYALDIHPLAIKRVRKMASQKGIKNVKTIQTHCDTGLPDNHVDVVLLYDTFHALSRPEDVLRELHRVLKPGGTLSFSDHHMKEQDIIKRVAETGMFNLLRKGEKTYLFVKEG